MNAAAVTADPIDELSQIKDELRVLWLALGNEAGCECYLVEVREHVNGLAKRVGDIVEQLCGEALAAMGDQPAGGGHNG